MNSLRGYRTVIIMILILFQLSGFSGTFQPIPDEKLVAESMREIFGEKGSIHWKKIPLNSLTVENRNKLKIYRTLLPDSLTVGITVHQGEPILIIPAEAKGKTLHFSFLLYYHLEKQYIVDVDVVEYRESHGGEVDLKVFRRQFYQKSNPEEVQFKRTIKSITGATISSRSLTLAVHDLLLILSNIREYLEYE